MKEQVVVVNGRFLRGRPTGLHRTARSLLDAALLAGLRAEVVAPPGVEDRRVQRTCWAPRGRAGDHLWEQAVLPRAARGRTVLSLANTAPLLASKNAVMVHDLSPLVGPQWFAPSMRLYGRLVLVAARRAELVLTVSRVVATELEQAGVPGDRIRVVRVALDRAFRPAPEEEVTALRARLGLERAYVVVVGWADPRKDLATAVAAHLDAARSSPHDLVLAGNRHPVFAPVEVPAVQSVRQVGYLPDADLSALLTGAAALVYPSLYEGFGLPPLEAWACGTPALVSDIPALRESTCGRAVYLPCGDAPAWAEAIVSALDGGFGVPELPAWGWSDAAAELLSALEGE